MTIVVLTSNNSNIFNYFTCSGSPEVADHYRNKGKRIGLVTDHYKLRFYLFKI